MATEISDTTVVLKRPARPRKANDSLWQTVRKKVLMPLASLRLTVVLFALSIVLVFTGTLAQVEHDIWEVMNLYFRAWWVNIPLQVFVPPAFLAPGQEFKVPGVLPFPGGFLIGSLMLINLIAAHALRFTFQAKGKTLALGIAILALGTGLIWLVVRTTSSVDTIQGTPSIGWSGVWYLFKGVLVLMWLAMVYGVMKFESKRRFERWLLTLVATGLGAGILWLFYRGSEAVPTPASLRILWQLMVAAVPAGILLWGCGIVFRKRAGIVLLHAGIGLMMVNELVVYSLHEEAVMKIPEGETRNYAEDIRTHELAVIDTSDPEHDDVVVVPRSYLQQIGETISNENLPFDIVPVRYYLNSSVAMRGEDDTSENLADTGVGLIAKVTQVPAIGGVVANEADIPAAYFKLISKENGEILGTYFATLGLNVKDKIEVNGKTYELDLRYKRNYKDYSIHLVDFQHDQYIGTKTASNFSSDVILVDPSQGIEREIKIWMNNPLRYAGETFYQSSFGNTAEGTEVTVLQVVKNTGWMIPYIACMIVGFGMLAQFSITLGRFLTRRADGKVGLEEIEAGAAKPPVGKKQKQQKAVEPRPSFTQSLGAMKWAIPVGIILLCGGWLSGKARVPVPVEGELNIYQFGQLPVVYEGRVKPFDTLARNSLRVISDKEEIELESGEDLLATTWLLDLIARPQVAATHPVFRIENLEVLDLLKLQRRDGFKYALTEFHEQLPAFDAQVEQARNVPPEVRTTYQRKLLELAQRFQLYMKLSRGFEQIDLRNFTDAKELISKMQKQESELNALQPPRAVPYVQIDANAPGGTEVWQVYASAWREAWLQVNLPPLAKTPEEATILLNRIFTAYAGQEVSEFNQGVTEYQKFLEKHLPEGYSPTKVRFEAFFNHLAPFYHASALYVFAFILSALAWLGWSKQLNWAAFWVIAFTLVLHTFALWARIYISGRPPVTNLYTSAVFIGWGCALLGLIYEIVYRMGIGNVVASIAGFSTLLIAHFLAGDGDTFTVLQAVLDTQFWLWTHVVTIALGYSTTLVAGTFGAIYILQGVFSPSLTPKMGKELSRMIYGTLCFSILFSFIGTVLGGLWADDSWGRFWGWDPKENGALMIVIWNALVLHARWGGMVKERGLAVLSIAGNICVSWSWFGVNELGIGLHSYGFTDGVLRNLGLFIISQLLIIAIGILPKEVWWSERRQLASSK